MKDAGGRAQAATSSSESAATLRQAPGGEGVPRACTGIAARISAISACSTHLWAVLLPLLPLLPPGPDVV